MSYRISILDKSPLAAGETAAQALARTLTLAQHAEAWGYHRFWVAEHHNTDQLASPSPELVIAWLLGHTRRIRLGSGGVMLQHYSPYKVAENFNLLAALAPGRIDLGVGKAPGGLPLSTRALQQGLHQEEKGTFADQLAQLDNWLLLTEPGGEESLRATPIPPRRADGFLLGASLESAELAARLDWDFVFAAHLNGDSALRRAVFNRWRELSPREAMVAVQVVVADDPATAAALAQQVEVWGVELENGQRVTVSALRQYDVATYDAGTRVIQVSDLKLTGVYEKVSPSPAAPITITLMGKEFDVLSTARDDLASFKIGDRITLLLTADGKQVAGAVSASTVRSDAVGIASYESDTSATVKLLQNGITLTGAVSASSRARCDNQLVTVTSGGIGKLTLTPVSGSDARGNLDTARGTVGERAVAENVVVYDRVQNGAMVEVDYDKLPAAVSRSRISFVSYDYAGRVKYLVLDDVTGDAYEYGIFDYTPASETKDDDGEVISSTPATLCVKQGSDSGDETPSKEANFTGSVRNGSMGGMAYTSSGRVAATVTLTQIKAVSRSAFDSEDMTVTVAGVEWPVSDKVQCYNKTTKTWFAPGEKGLGDIRAYADELDLYYDRPADEGGKIRMIVVP